MSRTMTRAAAVLACIALCAGCQKLGIDSIRNTPDTRVEKQDASEIMAAKAEPPDIHAPTRVSAGRMFEAEGNVPAAIEQYRAAIKSDPNNIEAYTRLGIACNRLQRFEDATMAFLRAIEIAPDRAYLHNNLGFCFILQERFDDAEKSFRNALALRPDYQRARMNLGTVLAQMGRSDEAVAEFEKVVTRDAAFYNLGLIMVSNRRYDAAEQAFRHSLALNSGSRDAATQIERIAQLRAGDAGTTGETAVVASGDSAEPVADESPAPIAIPPPAATSQPAPATETRADVSVPSTAITLMAQPVSRTNVAARQPRADAAPR